MIQIVSVLYPRHQLSKVWFLIHFQYLFVWKLCLAVVRWALRTRSALVWLNSLYVTFLANFYSLTQTQTHLRLTVNLYLFNINRLNLNMMWLFTFLSLNFIVLLYDKFYLYPNTLFTLHLNLFIELHEVSGNINIFGFRYTAFRTLVRFNQVSSCTV